MTDITTLFKATVKAVKSRQRAQGHTVGPDRSILGQAKSKSEFATKAKEVVKNITKLRDFLLEHRKDYINAASHLGTDTSKMTDAERDQIDDDAQTFIRTCAEAIRVFRLEAGKGSDAPQVKEHHTMVLKLMDDYLKVVCKVFSEQRAIRVKRVVDRKRIGRLEPERKRKMTVLLFEKNPSEKDQEEKVNSNQAKSTSWQDKTAKERPSHQGEVVDEQPVQFQEDEELSPEEAQMFEQENQQLYDEMNSLINEVKQVEGKVVEITRLQEIFADKVLEQDADIDRIAGTVVGATENIKDANEEIREAMKNNAGLRVWILFFLIVCSFSLLFLDWYND